MHLRTIPALLFQKVTQKLGKPLRIGYMKPGFKVLKI